MSFSSVKDFLREGGKSFNRFISMLIIVMIGAAFFVGVKSTSPSMKYTADEYYDSCNMSDIRLYSTLGLVQEDIDAIAALDNVESVQAGYYADVIAFTGNKEFVYRVHSMPTPISETEQQENAINKVIITEGRLPTQPGECVIEAPTVQTNHGYKIGDTIKVSSGTSTPITDGTLNTDEYTVVGIVQTPYYMCFAKESSDIGSGTVNFFLYVLEDNFTSQDYYIEALVTIKGGRELDTFSEDYLRASDRTISAIENLGMERCDIRLDSVKAMAYEALAEQEAIFEAEKASAQQQIADGEKQLEDALVAITQGEEKLNTSKEYYEQIIDLNEEKIATAEADLAQGKLDYQSGLAEYNQGLSDVQAGQAQLDQARREYNNTILQYGDQLTELQLQVNELTDMYDAAAEYIDSLNSQLEALEPYTPDWLSIKELLQPANDEFDKIGKDLNSAKDGLAYVELTIASSLDQLNAAQAELDAANAELADARQALAEAESTIANAEAELAAGKQQLAQSQRDAEAEFASNEVLLAESKQQYQDELANFEVLKADAEAQLKDAEMQLIDAKYQIEAISTPTWIVLDRSMIYSHASYESTTNQIDNIAQVFPVFFFLVAALVCLTTMTRMVDEQRGVMGTYKGLGYSNAAIFAKYGFYAMFASLIGGVIGSFLGTKFVPDAIFSAYSMMYSMPPLKETAEIPLIIGTVLISIAITVCAALYVCVKELKSCSAELMRPKAPKVGKPILLERIGFLWSSFSFSVKVTMRNIFRYKKKFFMTVFGIMGCTALILCGFGISDSVSNVVPNQFYQIFKYNVSARFSGEATSEDVEAVCAMLDANEDGNIKEYMRATYLNSTMKTNGADIGVSLIAPEIPEMFTEYITLRDRTSEKEFYLPADGIVIGEKLAKELGVSVGDNVALTINFGVDITRNAEVAAITENYVFHYAYLSPSYFKTLFGKDATVNATLIKLVDGLENQKTVESELGAKLLKNPGVSSTEYYTQTAETFKESVQSLNQITIIIIAFAGLLAFVVLYNLTNINIVERTREIATLKVLGFFKGETSMYVFRENILLTIIGSVFGLVVGIFLHKFIMLSIEMDGIMFGNHIDPLSFVYAFALTLVFSLVVNVFMRRRIVSIPMVESLKSVE